MRSVHVGTSDGDWLEMARPPPSIVFVFPDMGHVRSSVFEVIVCCILPFPVSSSFPSVPPPSTLFPPRSFSRRRRPPPDARRPTPDARRIAHNSARSASTPPPPCLYDRGSNHTTMSTPLRKSACYPLDRTRLSMGRNVPSKLLSLRHPPPSPPTTTSQL